MICFLILSEHSFAQDGVSEKYLMVQGIWERTYYENNEKNIEKVTIRNNTLLWVLNGKTVMRSTFLINTPYISLIERELYDPKNNTFIEFNEYLGKFDEFLEQFKDPNQKMELQLMFLRLMWPIYNFTFMGMNTYEIENTNGNTYLIIHKDTEAVKYQKTGS